LNFRSVQYPVYAYCLYVVSCVSQFVDFVDWIEYINALKLSSQLRGAEIA